MLEGGIEKIDDFNEIIKGIEIMELLENRMNVLKQLTSKF